MQGGEVRGGGGGALALWVVTVGLVANQFWEFYCFWYLSITKYPPPPISAIFHEPLVSRHIRKRAISIDLNKVEGQTIYISLLFFEHGYLA